MVILDNCPCLLRKWDMGQEATEPDMEQLTGSKFKKEFNKNAYCHPAYLTYMQSTSWEMLGWMSHKLESRFLGEISTTSDRQMVDHSNGRKWRGSKASWWEWALLGAHMLKNLSAMQVMVLGSGRSSGKGNGYSLQYSCLENSMSVKEEREKAGLKLNIQKLRSWHPVPSLHGK